MHVLTLFVLFAVSGIEGNYRSVCEVVMMVLREQRDSVMAMLEAFVHDPLINWGLIVKPPPKEASNNQPVPKKPKKPSNRATLSTLGPVNESDDPTGTPGHSNNKEEKGHNQVHPTGATGATGAIGATGATGQDRRPSTTHASAFTASTAASAASAAAGAAPPIKTTGGGMKRSKRASTKLSMQGGIKLANVHEALVKGDEKLALSLSSSGMAQSFAGGRSTRGRRLSGVPSSAAGSGGSSVRHPQTGGMLNQKAISVTARVRDKLTGRDFGNDEPLDARTQVNKLILQATSHENLSQCYIGWCPFW